MEVSDTCFIVFKDGKKLNMWEVYTVDGKGRRARKNYTFYYFKRKNDAELYRMYLLNKECLKVAHKNIKDPTVYKEETREWQSLADSINLKAFKEMVSELEPLIIKKSVKCIQL